MEITQKTAKLRKKTPNYAITIIVTLNAIKILFGKTHYQTKTYK